MMALVYCLWMHGMLLIKLTGVQPCEMLEFYGLELQGFFLTHRGQSFTVLAGSSQLILGKEGATEGDPLSVLTYSVDILPLIRFLYDKNKWHQNWFADDSSCAGNFLNIME